MTTMLGRVTLVLPGHGLCAGWELDEAAGSPWPCRAAPCAQEGLHRVGWARHRWSCRGCALLLCSAEIDKSAHLDLSCFPRWYLEMSQSYCSSPGWQIRGSLCLTGAGFRQRGSPAGRKRIAWLWGDRAFCCGSHEIKKCFFFRRTCWFKK